MSAENKPQELFGFDGKKLTHIAGKPVEEKNPKISTLPTFKQERLIHDAQGLYSEKEKEEIFKPEPGKYWDR